MIAPGDLERALGEAPLPGEGAARERARRTVLAAHAATPSRRRPRIAALAAAAVLVAAAGGGLTRPGQAVGEWLGHRFEVATRPAAPARTPVHRAGPQLPGPGRLLVASGRRLWIVERDGSKHSLGDWTSGAWSPHALHAAVTSGRTLAAVRPDGTVRWRRLAPARVADPRWAPDGLHIAYRAGDRMHLIWGNGLNDVALRGPAAPAAPAWRPTDAHTVAWARADGTVVVEDADTGLVLWSRKGGPVRRLSWSADGRRLLIAGRRRGAIYRLSGGAPQPLRLAPGESLTAAAFAPDGTRLALGIARDGVGAVRLLGARASLVETPQPLRSLTWSPDGRWLLTPSGDAWLVARASGETSVQELDGVRARSTALGWCC